ncbi:hypothetical protein F5Y04DRAFT_259062 [Hypomontagnella monticulosa]|nr:hypothetical protein F5Y04DRAFT_259062 [Hypomontagnella monticulosa]
MRPGYSQPIIISLLFSLVAAHPFPRDEVAAAAINNIAGNKFDYTTTWTETRTYTSTISSSLGASTAVAGSGEKCIPVEGTGQIACGPICCTNWQYCAHDGQCLPNAGAPSYTQWTTVGVVTTQYSAPYRVTSGSTIVQTPAPTTGTAASETASPTTSATPEPVASTSGQLSGGAIAGIVVGTIAGVILLLLLCFCCIVRGLWDVFAGIFGFGKRRRDTERVEITEEHYSRRGSRHGSAYGAAARPVHRTWFGGGGGRPTSAASRNEKRHSGGGGLGWMAAGLGAAALLLGLRRDKRRKASSQRPPRSDFSSSYYTDSYSASSPSEFIPNR